MDLINACARNQVDRAEKLINNGADVNSLDRDSCTPLHHAAVKGNLELINLLILNGAKVNSRSIWGHNPFHVTAWRGHLEASRVLISNGAEVDSKDNRGKTPLHYITEYSPIIEKQKSTQTDSKKWLRSYQEIHLG